MSGSPSSWQKAWYRGLKAVDRGDIKILQDLWFQYDQQILDSLPDESGTLLHYAARKSKHKVVAFLLKNGADPNARDLAGETPLFWAATVANVCTRTTEVIRLLVKYGADLNIQDYHGYCVVTLAVVRGAVEEIRRKRIELLLELGADPRVRCWDGLAPVDYMGQSTDGGDWTYSLPDNTKERKRSEVLLRAEMNRRDVKMLILVARRRLQKAMEEGMTVGGSATAAPEGELVAAAATGGSSDGPRKTKRSRRSSQEEGKEEEGQEEEGQEEEQQQEDVPIADVARRLVHLQDSVMFELCMNYV